MMTKIGTDQKLKILSLWRDELPDFKFVSKTVCMRLNSFIVSGIEFGLPDGGSQYKARVFCHSFNHDGSDGVLFFDGYKDYWYSTGEHGFGPKYLGKTELFKDFVDRIRFETILCEHLTISKLINFYEEVSVLGCDNAQTILANALAKYFLLDKSSAIKFIDDQKNTYIKYNSSGRWEEWRNSTIDCMNDAKVKQNKEKFLDRGKRRSLQDAGIIAE